MRRLALLTVCLLMLVPAIDVANAAGRKGTVGSSFISRTSGGKHETSFKSGSVKKLYANFVWKTPAAAGQILRIEWHDPKGDAARRLGEQDGQGRQEGHAAVRLGRPRHRQGQAGLLDCDAPGGRHEDQHQ